MLSTQQIEQQVLPHINELMQGYSDSQILEAYDWVVTVIVDYNCIYEPYRSIRKSDVEYFLEQYINYYHGDQAPAEPHDSWGEPLQEVS